MTRDAPAFDATDGARMQRALELAQGAVGITEPNPRVGCVIADAHGVVVGEGATGRAGGAHAEIAALHAARQAGAATRGATVWVTLEPCAHHGRTPPCCDALIEAGVARAVVAMEDPFPAVAGRGIARMRTAGIRVDMAPAAAAQQARELNIGFFSRVERGRPWVRLKFAISLDGRAALADGSSRWITSEAARTDGHAWRRRASAIVTGVGTVLADDPRLDVRPDTPELVQPLRVLLDGTLRTPVEARILQPPGSALLIATHAADERRQAFAAAGCEVLTAPVAGGGVDLRWLVAELARRQVNEVHVEAGPTLNAAWLQSGLVDEVLVYLAPRLIGPGLGPAALPPLQRLADALPLRLHAVTTIGDDVRLLLRPATAVGGGA